MTDPLSVVYRQGIARKEVRRLTAGRSDQPSWVTVNQFQTGEPMQYHDDANDNGNADRKHFRAAEPDAFDRAYGQAQGFPHTRESTITAANVMGIGGVRQYITQTYRVPEVGDSIFITITGPEGLTRVHLPPRVAAAIASQRDALTTQGRVRSAKARAAADKAAGKVPGFLRGKKKRLLDAPFR